MKLDPKWREICRRAWSIRLMLLGGALSGLEVILPLFSHTMPTGVFAALSGVTVCAAFVARLVAQEGL
jgi:hypothetical protein